MLSATSTRVMLLVCALCAGTYAANQKSCVDKIKTGNYTITVKDPLLGPVERRYLLVVPNNAAKTRKPLVLGFHGQGHSPTDWGPRPYFNHLAKQHQWVMAYPFAIYEDPDTTWNCGNAGDNTTCKDETSGATCKASCQKLGRCGNCNWASCYDDVAFMDQLLQHLQNNLCLNSEHFVVGESNGAMFIHHLISSMPGRFVAAAPVFGLPLLGYLVGAQYELLTQRQLARHTDMLHMHDRSDTTIPWQGGQSSDGWMYESRDRTVGVWAAIHGCKSTPRQVHNKFSGGPSNLVCYQYDGCENRVAYCMYDGGHGDWPDQPRAANLVWHFFLAAQNRTRAGRPQW